MTIELETLRWNDLIEMRNEWECKKVGCRLGKWCPNRKKEREKFYFTDDPTTTATKPVFSLSSSSSSHSNHTHSSFIFTITNFSLFGFCWILLTSWSWNSLLMIMQNPVLDPPDHRLFFSLLQFFIFTPCFILYFCSYS